MDDDRVSREQIVRMHDYDPNVEGPLTRKGLAILRNICDLALSALESRSEVLGHEGFYEKLWKDFVSLQRGDAIAICEKVERYYREHLSRAEPGAQDDEHEPDHAAEQDDTQSARDSGPASAAPEPAAPDQNMEQYVGSPAPDLTAAAHDVPEAYSRDYAQGRARGFAEGLEEAAKVCESIIYGMHKPHDRSGFLIACDEAFADGHRLATGRCAAAIRAKIKPTRGES